jgi:hypothetical protein
MTSLWKNFISGLIGFSVISVPAVHVQNLHTDLSNNQELNENPTDSHFSCLSFSRL